VKSYLPVSPVLSRTVRPSCSDSARHKVRHTQGLTCQHAPSHAQVARSCERAIKEFDSVGVGIARFCLL
jgi:hypothetical protein